MCIDHSGPGAKDTLGQLPDYLGSVVLVWVAFRWLPYSTRVEEVLPQGWQPPLEEGDCAKPNPNHRLQRLLYYDVISFILSLVVLLVLTLLSMDWELGELPDRSQTMENVFWCKVFYSILSLPFSFFEIPGMLKLLTHSTTTGYNKNGALVYFDLDGSDDEDDDQDLNFTRNLWLVNKFLRVATRGRQARGKEIDGQISPKDVVRGTWERFIHGREHDAPPSFVETFGPAPVTTAAHYSHALGCKMRETMRNLRPLPGGASRIESGESVSIGLHSVSSVRILDETEFAGGKPVYVIEVMTHPEVGQSWQVRRQYSDFVSLLKQFELPNNHFPDAPFPRYRFTHMNYSKLKARREGLNLWLSRVTEDKLCKTVYAGPLSDFLNIKQNSASARDSVQNVPKNFYLTPRAMTPAPSIAISKCSPQMSTQSDSGTSSHSMLSVPLLASPSAPSQPQGHVKNNRGVLGHHSPKPSPKH